MIWAQDTCELNSTVKPEGHKKEHVNLPHGLIYFLPLQPLGLNARLLSTVDSTGDESLMLNADVSSSKQDAVVNILWNK